MAINLRQNIKNIKNINSKLGLVKDFIVYVIVKFLRDNSFESASVLTFTMLFSLVPLITVSFVVLQGLPYFQNLWGSAEQYIFSHFVPSAGLEIQKYLVEFVHHAGDLTIIGIASLFLSSMVLIYTIEVIFDRIWGVIDRRGLINSILLYLTTLTMVPILMGLSFALSSYIWALPVLQQTESYIWTFTPLVFSWICFSLMYMLIPNCTVLAMHAVFGAFIAAVLFEIAKKLFAIYVTGINLSTLIYGTFSAIPLFLFWLYISWVIILLGAQIASSMRTFKN